MLDLIKDLWGFMRVRKKFWLAPIIIILLLLMATGLDFTTAFSAVAASLNNLGPGLGEVANGFMTMPDTAKWISIAGMLLGRLEIFTLLVLITPTFWRR